MPIAVHACQSQVRKIGPASVLAGNDMIHMKEAGIQRRAHMAVLTTLICARPDGSDQTLIHEPPASGWRRAVRASACITVSRLAT